MSAYVVMKFATNTGTDVSLTIPNVNADLTALALHQAMQAIIQAQAVDAGTERELTDIQSGTLYKVTTQTFQFV